MGGKFDKLDLFTGYGLVILTVCFRNKKESERYDTTFNTVNRII